MDSHLKFDLSSKLEPNFKFDTSSKQYSIHNSRTHSTVDCGTHLHRLKSQLKCYSCGDENLVKDVQNPKKDSIETHQHADLTVYLTFSTSVHIPVKMWHDINRQLEDLKLQNRVPNM